MITVEAIHTAPVKSLGLVHPETVHVGSRGIVEDRRLYLIDQHGQLLTQRQHGALVRIAAHYRAEPEWLDLLFPDGLHLEGPLELGEVVRTPIWGRHVPGRVLHGPWNQALSAFCGEDIRLVRSNEAGRCFDEFPISLVSQASLAHLSDQTGGTVTFDSRRFRPTFVLQGCEPHAEDAWLGRVLQIGAALRLRIMARDPRCAITTLDPTTGHRDVDTLRYILGYRPSPRAAYFGVYGIVEDAGQVNRGDTVSLLPPRGNA